MNSVATEQLWIDFGLDSAVFLDYIAHWLYVNSKHKQPRNYYEGRYWTYNTLEALHGLFPGWSKDTIRRIIRNCVKSGLLIVSNFNKKKYDRTCWYTLTDEALKYYPKLSNVIQHTPDNPGGVSCGDSTTWDGGSTTPIPNTLTSLSNINNITTSDNPKISCQEVVDAYHEVLPDSPKINTIGNELTKQIKSMIRNWPKYNKSHKPFTIEHFKDYLKYIKDVYSWFIQPYPTENGRKRQNNLTNITRERNIVRIINGEFSAS